MCGTEHRHTTRTVRHRNCCCWSAGSTSARAPQARVSSFLTEVSNMELRTSSKCSGAAKACLVAAQYAEVTVEKVVDETAVQVVLTGAADGDVTGTNAVLRYSIAESVAFVTTLICCTHMLYQCRCQRAVSEVCALAQLGDSGDLTIIGASSSLRSSLSPHISSQQINQTFSANSMWHLHAVSGTGD